MEQITFENVRMKCDEGVVIVDAIDIRLIDVHVECKSETGLRTQNTQRLNLTNFTTSGASEGHGGELVGNL